MCLGKVADSPEPQRHKEDAPSPAPGQLALFSSGREGEVEGHAAHEWQAARGFQKDGEAAPHPYPLSRRRRYLLRVEDECRNVKIRTDPQTQVWRTAYRKAQV